MATFMDRIRGVFNREPLKPTKEQGVAGFISYGGYVGEVDENQKTYGWRRWKAAQDMLATVSVLAASIRFMSNLIARPDWSWQPADDSKAAEEAAEFMQAVFDDMDVSWTRVVRRSIMFKFHGFMLQEWVARKGDDGRIYLKTIESRPQRTITKWDLDDSGQILGFVQSDPQSGAELYLPRNKCLYLVDDTLTDRPDGMGWFHHLVEPAQSLKSLLDLERIGFERDLRGIPVGRAPMSEIQSHVQSGKLTQDQADAMISDLREFVAMQRKSSETGMVFDSAPYKSSTEGGENISSMLQWGIELISGEPQSVEEMGAAIKRMQFEIALILGTENLMTGRDGEGSRALSEDKSRNLYLTANSILSDIAEAVERDIRDTIWAMNGLDDALKPSAMVEDVSFKDAVEISQALANMATAGAVLAPDDPAIDDLRQLLGISDAIPPDESMLAAMNGQDPSGGGSGGGSSPAPSDQDDTSADDEEAARKALAKFDPNQPRAPAGTDNGGQWVPSGGGSPSVLFEVAPHPDSEIAERWDKLSDEQKLAITSEIAEDLTPEVLDYLGVEGHLAETIGGFEGKINPSLELQISGEEIPAASIMGEALAQKSMVVASATPMDGLDRVGIAAIQIPTEMQNVNGVRDIFQKVSDNGIDGFTFRNGQMELLNFTGMSDDDFARSIDESLGGSYTVRQSQIYSRLIEETDYDSGEGKTRGDSGRKFRDSLRQSVQNALEAKLKEFGKSASYRGQIAKRALELKFKKFDPNQPRDDWGRWTDGSATDPDSDGKHLKLKDGDKKRLTDALKGKTAEEMVELGKENQLELRKIADSVESGEDLIWVDPGAKSLKRVKQKLRDEGYEGAHEITDYSRGTFVVNGPQEADDVVAALAKSNKVYDKGWVRLKGREYMDRKLYVEHDNGGISEIQLVPYRTAIVKGGPGIPKTNSIRSGLGHKLYEVSRNKATPPKMRERAVRLQARLYSRAMKGPPPSPFLPIWQGKK